MVGLGKAKDLGRCVEVLDCNEIGGISRKALKLRGALEFIGRSVAKLE